MIFMLYHFERQVGVLVIEFGENTRLGVVPLDGLIVMSRGRSRVSFARDR